MPIYKNFLSMKLDIMWPSPKTSHNITPPSSDIASHSSISCDQREQVSFLPSLQQLTHFLSLFIPHTRNQPTLAAAATLLKPN
jgi:hypothetical protein